MLFNDCVGGTRKQQFGPVEITLERVVAGARSFERTTSVRGLVAPMSTNTRKEPPLPPTPAPRGSTDKGHVMGLRLGGPNQAQNIVWMWPQWQRNGEWARMEHSVYNQAAGLPKGEYLLFQCDVLWLTQATTLSRMTVPTGFVVTVTTGTLAEGKFGMDGFIGRGAPTMYNFDQHRDATDDLLLFRTEEALERKRDPGFDLTQSYPDLARNKQGKLTYRDEAAITASGGKVAPPPVSAAADRPQSTSHIQTRQRSAASQTRGLLIEQEDRRKRSQAAASPSS